MKRLIVVLLIFLVVSTPLTAVEINPASSMLTGLPIIEDQNGTFDGIRDWVHALLMDLAGES